MSAVSPHGSPDVAPGKQRNLHVTPVARIIGLLVGVITAAMVSLGCWMASFPAGPEILNLRIRFPEGRPGAGDPILTTGIVERGDTLHVRYIDTTTGEFHYSSPGFPGVSSAPFALTTGVDHTLRIEMPAVTHAEDSRHSGSGRLRVVLDGREVLSQSVPFHGRTPEQLYFAINALRSGPAPRFLGTLMLPDGTPLRGGPAEYFGAGERLTILLKYHWSHVAGACLLGVAAAFSAAWAVKRLAAYATRPLAASSAPRHGTFLAASALSAVLFVALMTGGTFRLIYPEVFGAFYDHQAQSLLEGRLDVPRHAMHNEEFVVGGKFFGYFGVTPALLRLPFVITDIGFGHLSRPFMLAYFLASLSAAYALLCHATRMVCGPGNYPSRWAIVLMIGSGGLGSTLFFLGSRTYTYHEAILCGAAFALWSAYFALRHLETPALSWEFSALACGTLAVHARPTAGMFALFLFGCVSAFHGINCWRLSAHAQALRHAAVGLAAALAFLSFNAMSYLKFGTFDGAPFKYSVQYNAERLARFEGTNFHLVNFRHDFETYLLRPGLHLERRFPFVIFGSRSPRRYPEAKLDLTEATSALPYATPALFVLAVAGGLWSFASVPRTRRALLIVIVAAFPMTFALFIATATSHRYTADFCPVLIALAAYGLAVCDAEPPRRRKTLLAIVTFLMIASVFVTGALSMQYQGERVWGVQPEAKQNYQWVREHVDGWFGTGRP